MITVGNIKKAAIELLKTKYPQKQYKYYGNDIKDGLSKPSFFTQILPLNVGSITKNQAKSSYLIALTYFQKEPDEFDNLTKFSEIRELIGRKLKVEDRYFNVSDLEYDFVGADGNILQVKFSISINESTMKQETQPIMKEIGINQKLEV